MNWFAAVDAYCERTGPEYWSEPVNALTNLAFLLAAILMWPGSKGLPLARALTAILALVGIGSWLFHTHAQAWAGLADVSPILAFILLYTFAAARDFLRLSPAGSLMAALAFFPYAAATVPLFALVPGLGSSAGYAPVPLLILIFAALLRRTAPATARGLALGAGLLTLSLAFRTLDAPLCGRFPLGTHFLWHLLNAAMLAHMIAVYRRHRLAGPRATP